MSTVLARFIDWVWVVIAALLITGAVVVTAFRMVLPELNSQRDTLTDWISTTIGRPAIVGDIDASWHGWSPRISAHGLALLDPSEEQELVRFERATINIALLDSLLAGALKPRNLVLSGVALTLLRDADGRFSVAGMPPPKSPILRWLAEQDNFAVTEADLTIIDAVSQRSFALRDAHLAIRNRGDRRHLTAIADLPDAIGKRIVIKLVADGDPLGSEWDGELNFRLEAINSTYLVEQLDWHGAPPAAGAVSVVGWSRWSGAQMQSLRFDVAVADTAANTTTPKFTARGSLARRASGWLLQTVDMHLPQAPRSAPSARMSVAWDHVDDHLARVTARAIDLPLAFVTPLAAGLAPMSDAQREIALGVAASGTLNTLDFAWRTAGGDTTPAFFADAALGHGAIDEHGNLPGLSGIDATIAIRSNGARVSFDATDFKLNHAHRLVETLSFSAVSGDLIWRRDTPPGVLSASAVRGEVNGTRFRADGRLAFAPDASPDLDLRLDLPQVDAPRLHQLLPRKLLPARGEAWMRTVLRSGRVHDGLVLIRGPLAQFPYRNQEGVFTARFDLADATVAYSNRWPHAEHVAGRLSFNGPRVHMRVDHAEIMQAVTERGDITMDDLFTRERYVSVNGNIRGAAMSAGRIIMASPLKNGRAARVAGLDMAGDIDVKLDMNIGLFPHGPREVLGQARFDGNRITAPQENITLDDFSGVVSFTRGDWYGEGITAKFRDIPVGLVINGGLADPNYDSEFRMTGTADAATVMGELRHYAPRVWDWLDQHASSDALSGSMPWKAVLTIPIKHTDGSSAPRRLVLESSLDGLAVALPWPLGKGADEQRPVHLEMAVMERLTTAVAIHYDDILDARITNRRGADGRAQVASAEIELGRLDPAFSGADGIHFRGYLPRLNASDWLALLGQRRDRGAGRPSPGPFTYDLQIGDLELFGNRFRDLHIQGERQDGAWHAAIKSEQAAGVARIPTDLSAARLTLDFDRLHLDRGATAAPAAQRSGVDPRSLPAVDFSAREFHFGDVALGAATIATSRTTDGLHLDKLHFTDSTYTLDAAGDWLLRNDMQTSRFDIKLHSETLAGVLQRFGYTVANIKDGVTDMQIDASWPGPPVAFSLPRLTGNFELHVADGSILDIEPGGGRLFGLLSLQMLPRRLLLDFDDIFRKGFVFDSIDGVFVLENGNAYTNSLQMSGPSARVNISGRTGLADQDYDQSVVVTPALSSTIPVAGALFGPIGVGAGAVYYLGQKMFKSIPEQIDKFLSRKYTVTGPWANPAIERL